MKCFSVNALFRVSGRSSSGFESVSVRVYRALLIVPGFEPDSGRVRFWFVGLCSSIRVSSRIRVEFGSGLTGSAPRFGFRAGFGSSSVLVCRAPFLVSGFEPDSGRVRFWFDGLSSSFRVSSRIRVGFGSGLSGSAPRFGFRARFGSSSVESGSGSTGPAPRFRFRVGFRVGFGSGSVLVCRAPGFGSGRGD
ncbi:hypothetical protein BV898_11254 [Hypsibius exemplaris]|uniref:Uncharacterized protein n=1 Tax=Hypsibius exemplaris TaxID=2072580 RepID=A0A1W0WHD2_HYPEX|nr:hypothetical protein BV898_11254 [Hypsibius exemplaris]